MLLDESNIAMFEPQFTFCHVGRDTFEAVQGGQYSDMYVPRLCFWMSLISHCLRLDLHFVM